MRGILDSTNGNKVKDHCTFEASKNSYKSSPRRLRLLASFSSFSLTLSNKSSNTNCKKGNWSIRYDSEIGVVQS